MLRTLCFIILLAVISGAAAAQTGGQFCVRSFEDRNGNGTLDGGEPLLSRGVSAELQNADGVIVASALLAESPNAAQGVICFQFLAPGSYSMIVTSADYTATTPTTFEATISQGSIPTLVTFGGQRVSAAPADTATDAAGDGALALDEDFLQRIVLSLLGALVVMAGMIVLGILIYMVAFRERRQDYVPQRAPTTGSVPPVPPEETTTDTDEIEPVT